MSLPTVLALDWAMRGGTVALLLLTAGMLARDYRGLLAARLGVLFAVGTSAYAICSAAGMAEPHPWAFPLLALSSGNNVVFWLLASALFDDGFRLRPWHAGLWLLLVALGLGECLVGSRLHGYFPTPPTGALMSNILAPFGAGTVKATLDIYRSVLVRSEPLRIRGDGAMFAQQPKYFDAILAPLSDAGGAATLIFGAFVFEWNFAPGSEGDPMDGERAWAAAIALR